MSLTKQIADHLRQVYFGGNWTSVSIQQTLADVDWQKATTKIDSLNTIALLVFHTHYYVEAILKVLQGEPLQAHDKFSFDMPTIQSQEDWKALVNQSLADAEQLAALIEQLPESKLFETFADEKYGNYYRNLHGVIEHTHYHLGQIAIIKKLLGTENSQ